MNTSSLYKKYITPLLIESAESEKMYSKEDYEEYKQLLKRNVDKLNPEDLEPRTQEYKDFNRFGELKAKFTWLFKQPFDSLEPWQQELLNQGKKGTGPSKLYWSDFIFNNKSWGGEDSAQALKLKKLLGKPDIFKDKFLDLFMTDETREEKDDRIRSSLYELFDANTYKDYKSDVDASRRAREIFRDLMESYQSSDVRAIIHNLPTNLTGSLKIIYERYVERNLKDEHKLTKYLTALTPRLRPQQYHGILQPVNRSIQKLFDPSFYRGPSGEMLSFEEQLDLAKGKFEEIFSNERVLKNLSNYESMYNIDYSIAEDAITAANEQKSIESFLNFALRTFNMLDKPRETRPTFVDVATQNVVDIRRPTNLKLQDPVFEALQNAAITYISNYQHYLPQGFLKIITNKIKTYNSISDFDNLIQVLTLDRFSISEAKKLALRLLIYNLKAILEDIITSHKVYDNIEQSLRSISDIGKIEQILRDNLILKCSVKGEGQAGVENKILDAISTDLSDYLDGIAVGKLPKEDKNSLINKINKNLESDSPKLELEQILAPIISYDKKKPKILTPLLLRTRILRIVRERINLIYLKFYENRTQKTGNESPVVNACLTSPETVKNELGKLDNIAQLIAYAKTITSSVNYEKDNIYVAARQALLDFATALLKYIIKKDNYINYNIEESFELHNFEEINTVISDIFPERQIDVDEFREKFITHLIGSALKIVTAQKNQQQATDASTIRAAGRRAIGAPPSFKNFSELQDYVENIEGQTGLSKISFATGDRREVSQLAQVMINATRESPRKKKAAIQALDNMFASDRIKKFVYDRYLRYVGLGVGLVGRR